MGSTPELEAPTQQGTRRTMPTPTAKAGNLKRVGTAHEDTESDYTNANNEVHPTRRISAHHGPPHSGGNHRQLKPSARTLASSSLQEPDIPGLKELPEKVDRLSADMRNVQSVLKELQQDNHEKIILKKNLGEVQEQLKEATLGFEEARKKWKKAASQLDQLRSQGTGLYQLPDSELISSARQLRYDIRNFSIRYFLGKAPGNFQVPSTSKFWQYMQHVTGASHDYEVCLMSETNGPIAIQSFLWRLLVGEVAERFYWIPELHKPMTTVYQALQSVVYDAFDQRSPSYPETERRFQMWKASTSALVIEYIRNTDDEKAKMGDRQFIRGFSETVFEVISSFVRNTDEEILNDLIHIIESFITLDQGICRQAALVEWKFPLMQGRVQFDPNFMAVEKGEVSPQPGQDVSMVMSPSLMKRGKSTGEDFETEYLLLKMDVTCMPLS